MLPKFLFLSIFLFSSTLAVDGVSNIMQGPETEIGNDPVTSTVTHDSLALRGSQYRDCEPGSEPCDDVARCKEGSEPCADDVTRCCEICIPHNSGDCLTDGPSTTVIKEGLADMLGLNDNGNSTAGAAGGIGGLVVLLCLAYCFCNMCKGKRHHDHYIIIDHHDDSGCVIL